MWYCLRSSLGGRLCISVLESHITILSFKFLILSKSNEVFISSGLEQSNTCSSCSAKCLIAFLTFLATCGAHSAIAITPVVMLCNAPASDMNEHWNFHSVQQKGPSVAPVSSFLISNTLWFWLSSREPVQWLQSWPRNVGTPIVKKAQFLKQEIFTLKCLFGKYVWSWSMLFIPRRPSPRSLPYIPL